MAAAGTLPCGVEVEVGGSCLILLNGLRISVGMILSSFFLPLYDVINVGSNVPSRRNNEHNNR